MGPIWQVQLGRAWLCSLAPAGNPIYCPIGHQIRGPLGKQDLCPNFALTAAKFVFSNSGNFRAKANLPKPRSCPKRPFGQGMGQNSSADWDAYQHCPASDALVTVSAMSRTMEALGSWMSSNRLRLNMYIYYIYIYISQKTLEEHHA